MTEPVWIKETDDGRAVEVIDGWVCLAGVRESNELVPLEEHPNRQAIRRAVPLAVFVAGRLPLTMAEASMAASAMRKVQDHFDGSTHAVTERLRQAAWSERVIATLD